jgi:hypothetical protein
MYFTLCATSELAMSRFSNFIILLPERVSRAIILSIIAIQPMRLLYKTGRKNIECRIIWVIFIVEEIFFFSLKIISATAAVITNK